MDAENFESIETLKDGTSLKIRAIKPADKARVAEAFSKLAPESIYTRFFEFRKSLSDRELRAATEVDFDHVVALVVVRVAGDAEAIIGGGRYMTIGPSAAPRCAEVAFLVGEDFRGQGIAALVLKHLAQIAQAKGVGQFEAEVLPQNRAMLAVFAHSGFPLKQHCAQGIVHVTLSLTNENERATGH